MSEAPKFEVELPDEISWESGEEIRVHRVDGFEPVRALYVSSNRTGIWVTTGERRVVDGTLRDRMDLAFWPWSQVQKVEVDPKNHGIWPK